MYAELHCISNFTFLRGASHPEELVQRAAELGYAAIAITDECSLAGVVRAHGAAREHGIPLIIGSEFRLREGVHLVLLAPDRAAYGELASLISRGRRRSPKGTYDLGLNDLEPCSGRCLALWRPTGDSTADLAAGHALRALFADRLWLGVSHCLDGAETASHAAHRDVAARLGIPLAACGEVHMHVPQRKPLQDVLTAIRLNTPVAALGRQLAANAERHLRPLARLRELYPPALLAVTLAIAARCRFSLAELRYEYPDEVVPPGVSPAAHLAALVAQGAARRWPGGVPEAVAAMLARELAIIHELGYEHYFLTVHDIVAFARGRGILCQGRGSAANSAVCYCLSITEVSPTRVNLLFERFISKERNEPPDIDVDFEHERREEVIQYIYKKYGRERAALVASLTTYRLRSAVRDVAKALGLDPLLTDRLAQSLTGWDRNADLEPHLRIQLGDDPRIPWLARLVSEIRGFPRHLSQHVGGFVISRGPISQLVPVENAAMPERTIIQWDKDDIEALGLLKIDVLALGMLSAIRKCLDSLRALGAAVTRLQDIPEDDPATYDMLCRGDSVGVFQVESRAQMSMLPRLRPRCYYDLVIQVAIVRPGPIQGDMVHPYLRRREGSEPVTYPNAAIQGVLERTLGVPIFQEQAIKLAMVAAGFSGGEADQLRRAMASWGKHGNLAAFERKLIDGMATRGYSADFAHRLFEQIKGFSGYGFPESHSASFALLVYVSAWLKCHHPAAFYCALLNSQPMGFYSPSQLVQDARRHGIAVRPADVARSTWDHLLEPGADGAPALRLGLRLVRGLHQGAAARLVQARGERSFADVEDLARRADLDRGQLAALADAGTLRTLSAHRHQAHWNLLAIEECRPLLAAGTGAEPRSEVQLPAPTRGQDLLADYRGTGLSLGPHPMALLRGHPAFRTCARQQELTGLRSGRFLRIAGLVTGRQRPGTAAGVIFLTLEDETGNTNVIVWRDVQDRHRAALLGARLLLVKGVLEHRHSVCHVIAGELQDHSGLLASLALKSRDFH
ncbi:MAG: error-prone DNA polymerase [Gammaproteobacteria bacterium]|nr:error-prone DNA polymerase [Gammaproteobacteria bacterium]